MNSSRPVFIIVFLILLNPLYSVAGKLMRVIAVGGLNVRSKPSVTGGKRGALTYGTRVLLLKKQKESTTINFKSGYWVLIRTISDKKINGWIFDAYLEDISRPFISLHWRLFKRRFRRTPKPNRDGRAGANIFAKYLRRDNSSLNYKSQQRTEKVFISRYSKLVVRKGLTLRLRLANGRWLSITDNLKAKGNPDRYYFRGMLGNKNFYIIHRPNNWPEKTVLLINASTGKRFSLVRLPAESPNKRYFAMITGGFGDYLEIWKISSDKLQRVFRSRYTTPILFNPAWVGPRTVRVIRKSDHISSKSINFHRFLDDIHDYLIVTLIKGKWCMF